MKIALDISPLESGHKVRGTGFYVKHLKNALMEYFSRNEYVFFTNYKKLGGTIDIVHYPYFDPFFLTLPRQIRYPTVVTVHDLIPLVFPEHFPSGIKGNLKWFIQKSTLKKTEAIITDSEASKRDIIKFVGIAPKKVHVVYLAAGDEFKKIQDAGFKIQALKERYKIPKKFVLYVGDATWNKNLPHLLEAIKAIGVTLVMVGKVFDKGNIDISNPWNEDLARVKELAKSDNRIIQLGFIPSEELVTLYRSATVMAMPSLYEGFGLPVIEAMQSGCPVITTKKGSLPEVAGDSCRYVDPYDAHSIANGIGEVFFHDSLQQELSTKGRKQAEKFSWKKTAEQTIVVYEKILTGK